MPKGAAAQDSAGGKGMKLSWVEDFPIPVNCRNFFCMNKQRHVTQPAPGRRVGALEQGMGTPPLAGPGKIGH